MRFVFKILCQPPRLAFSKTSPLAGGTAAYPGREDTKNETEDYSAQAEDIGRQVNDDGKGPEADLDEMAIGDREQDNDERNWQPDQHAECSCDKGSAGHSVTVNAILSWNIGDKTQGAKP